MPDSALPPLPLLHEDDSFVLHLSDEPLRLTRIVRYESNRNVDGTALSFSSLDDGTRRAIIQQVQRRYPGRTVRVVC